jgi:hypothetical protein
VKLKLKENPREWQKFATVMMVLISVLATLAWRRGYLPYTGWGMIVSVAALVALTAWVYAPPFRGFYRRGMTISFHVGQFMGKVMLTVFFLFLVTPLGLILRLCGKDLLRLRRATQATTYWQSPRPPGSFDRQF